MNTFLRFSLFSLPYIRKYWLRFSIGIILGFFYGMSNGVTLGCVSTLLQRLTIPQHIQSITDAGKAAAQKPDANVSWTTQLEQETYVAIDPWLPLRNRPMDWKQGLGLFLMFPLLAFTRGMLGYGSTYLLAWVGQRITNDVKVDAFTKLCSLSPEFFNQTPTTIILNHLENDTSGLKTFLLLGLTDLFQQPFTVLSLFVAMYYIDPTLTLVAVIFVPLFIIPTQAVGKKIKKMVTGDNFAMVLQASIAIETFNNIRVIKAYCLEAAQSLAFDKSGKKGAYFSMKMLQTREMLSPILETLSMAGVSAIFLFVVGTQRPIESLGTFLFAMIMFFAPIKRLSSLNVYFVNLNMGAERLMDMFELEPGVKESKNPIPFKSFQREICFNKVSLDYSSKPRKSEEGLLTDEEAVPMKSPVLNDLSFTVSKGRRLGLAGESGAGKSSILLLLMRFWDPTRGSVEIDGVKISDMTFEDLRAQIAYVTQEVQLYNQSISENIRFGRLDATQEEIIKAAKQAHAHDFIQSLPNGYDTEVGERGVILSGGQRQRIAIARAFVRNAPILVLDEATASLDSQSEAEVQKAIDDLAINRTVICVAHRLSTLKNMDEIIVLRRGGEIAERAPFKELLERGGLFTQMAAAQNIVTDGQAQGIAPSTSVSGEVQVG